VKVSNGGREECSGGRFGVVAAGPQDSGGRVLQSEGVREALEACSVDLGEFPVQRVSVLSKRL